MRRFLFGLAFAGGAIACGASYGAAADAPGPDAGDDAPVAPDVGAGDGPTDAGAIDATDAADAADTRDAFVPACIVNVVPGPAATAVSMTPNPATVGQALAFAASSTFGYTDVAFKVCVADGSVLTDHVNGPINGTYVWNYSRPGGLPKGFAQIQFYGRTSGASAVAPRATLIVDIKPP